ncbi:MAG: glutathione peroxidase [Bacteroidetes bacterium]|nr:glutathione peroxidase [Bacteroidota bacterium]MBS1932688.1 glutathione peroxidase [Bacteroidota bacterium]
MTLRQSLLKSIYPVFIFLRKLSGSDSRNKSNSFMKEPVVSFYSLKTNLNNGTEIDFKNFEGKKVLLVNTASDCGFTPQYEELQKLYTQYVDKLVVIAFPSNDFKQQEKGSDEEIAAFCEINYGVTFPLTKKSVVRKNGEQNNVFQWLSDKAKNGWNDQPPTWNFSKYLVDEKGTLLAYYDPSVSPLSNEIVTAISK